MQSVSVFSCLVWVTSATRHLKDFISQVSSLFCHVEPWWQIMLGTTSPHRVAKAQPLYLNSWAISCKDSFLPTLDWPFLLIRISTGLLLLWCTWSLSSSSEDMQALLDLSSSLKYSVVTTLEWDGKKYSSLHSLEFWGAPLHLAWRQGFHLTWLIEA